MKTKYLIFILIAFGFIITGSCKKYPDGPLISLRSKSHRVDGEWTIEYFSINGIDSTEYLKNKKYYGYYSFTKEKEGKTEFAYYSTGGSDTSSSYAVTGKWGFENHKSNIYVQITHRSHPWKHFNLALFDETLKISWQIQRLTEKEMWLKGNYVDGREYFFKLRQKNR